MSSDTAKAAVSAPPPPLHHTESERAVVEAQLGRPVRGDWAVARRCHLGIPMVIENHPVIDGKPFPTTFWLTCPILVQGVSRLEAAGVMTALTDRLGRDPTLKERFAAAISRYRARRDARASIEDSGAPPGGGPDRVKCLHAHVAHELVDGANPMGGIALSATGWPDCIAPCVAQSGEDRLP